FFPLVMAGLDPAIHVFGYDKSKTWMPGSADKFTQSAQARLRAGHDELFSRRHRPPLTGPSVFAPAAARRASRAGSFILNLGLDADVIAIDRGDREQASFALVADQAVPVRDAAVDRDLVKNLGVADIVDRHVIVLAPEERHRVERLVLSQHVARGG